MVQSRISCLFVLLCLCAYAAAGPQGPRVIYVDGSAAGTDSGASWQDAYRYLQDALAEAQTAAQPVEIRIAQGVYRPDQGTGIESGDKTAGFRLLDGVTLMGGYRGVARVPGTPGTRDTRDCDAYETILSGDLKSDDKPGPTRIFDNSCRVVIAAGVGESAVLDGLTITAGGAPGTECSDAGGGRTGMTIDAGSPLLRRCRFASNNGAALFIANGSTPTVVQCEFRGGWAAAVESSPTFLDCTFDGCNLRVDDNSAASLTGCLFESADTGLASRQASRISLADCQFRKNTEWALQILDANAVLMDCTFEANGGGPKPGGGALYFGGAELSLAGCRFIANVGCGIESHDARTISLTHCSFVANKGERAGAISATNLTLCECEFTGNSSTEGTGAVATAGDYFKAVGCLFTGNTDIRRVGAGAVFSYATILHVSNCTFAGNRGRTNAIDHRAGTPLSQVRVTQCIVRDGPAPFAWHLPPGSDIAVTYSSIQGDHPGEGNIDVDPCFVGPGYWADPNEPNLVLGPEDPCAVWRAGDYHLKSQAGHWDRETRTWVRDEVTSACIDAGDPNAPLGIEPFPNGGYVNLGAYGGSGEASKSYFGEPACETQIAGDINGDCKVDQTDMDIMLSHWLTDAADLVNAPPTITLIQPRDGETFEYPTALIFWANVADADGSVLQVRFVMEYAGNSASFLDTNPSNGWTANVHWWQHTGVPFNGTCTVWAEAMDDDGAVTVSPKAKVTLKVSN